MICRDLCTFWKNMGKKMPSWVKKSVSWAKSALLYYTVHITYYTELNMQICNYAQNDAFVTKMGTTRRTKSFVAIFALAGRQSSSATLSPPTALITASL